MNTYKIVKLKLIGSPVPSLKNNKMILWKQKRVMTKPETQEWMKNASHILESQLLCIFQITEGEMQTGVSQLSWMLSVLPEDDCWTQIPEITIKCRKCPKGAEGAEILIEKLP